MVMYAPGGLAGLLMQVTRVVSQGFFRQLLPVALAAFGSLAVAAAGGVVLTELLYQITLESATGSEARLLWVTVDTSSGAPWALGVAAVSAGLAGFMVTKPRLTAKWIEVSLAMDQLSLGKRS